MKTCPSILGLRSRTSGKVFNDPPSICCSLNCYRLFQCLIILHPSIHHHDPNEVRKWGPENLLALLLVVVMVKFILPIVLALDACNDTYVVVMILMLPQHRIKSCKFMGGLRPSLSDNIITTYSTMNFTLQTKFWVLWRPEANNVREHHYNRSFVMFVNDYRLFIISFHTWNYTKTLHNSCVCLLLR